MALEIWENNKCNRITLIKFRPMNEEKITKDETNEEEKEYDNGFKPKEVHLKPDYIFYRKNFWYKVWNRIVVYICSFVFFFPKFFVYNFRVKGKKYRKFAKGSIMICNHVHAFDVIFIITTFRRHLFYQTTLQSNLGFGFVSKIFTGGGSVPIPTESLQLMRNFRNGTIKTLNMGYPILFMPEGHLIVQSKKVREFMPGAFHYAYESNSKTILPTVITFHKPKGIFKLIRRKKPTIRYNILPPYHIEELETKKQTLKKATDDLHEIMSKYYLENSDYFL